MKLLNLIRDEFVVFPFYISGLCTLWYSPYVTIIK